MHACGGHACDLFWLIAPPHNAPAFKTHKQVKYICTLPWGFPPSPQAWDTCVATMQPLTPRQVCGAGGSALATDTLLARAPEARLIPRSKFYGGQAISLPAEDVHW